MLYKIDKTNKKLFTLIATSLLGVSFLPACSFDKTSASGMHNNEVAETNLNNQSQNYSNQVNIDSQKYISNTCMTSSMDDGIYIDIPIEGIDDGIYIDIPIEGIDDGIYIDPPSCDRPEILFI